MSYSELTDEKNGYIKDDKIGVCVKLKTESVVRAKLNDSAWPGFQTEITLLGDCTRDVIVLERQSVGRSNNLAFNGGLPNKSQSNIIGDFI